MPTFGPQDVGNQDDGFGYGGGPTWRSTAAGIQAGTRSAGEQDVGFWWDGITVTAGPVTVTSATLDIEENYQTGTPALILVGDDADDAPKFSGSDLPRNVTRTTATVDYDANYSGNGVKLIDIAAIVQEVVDRTGWATSQAIRFGILHDGGTGGYNSAGWVGNNPYATDDNVPQLTIKWSAAAAGARPQGPLGHPFHGPFGGPL